MFAQVKIEILRLLPICAASTEKQKSFIDIVKKISSICCKDGYLDNSSKQEEVQSHMQCLDKMIYQLYELTPDEIKIIEGCDHGK